MALPQTLRRRGVPGRTPARNVRPYSVPDPVAQLVDAGFAAGDEHAVARAEHMFFWRQRTRPREYQPTRTASHKKNKEIPHS